MWEMVKMEASNGRGYAIQKIGSKGLRMHWLCTHFLCYQRATHYLVYGLSRSRRCETHAKEFAAQAHIDFPEA